jgi:hypothetical protein
MRGLLLGIVLLVSCKQTPTTRAHCGDPAGASEAMRAWSSAADRLDAVELDRAAACLARACADSQGPSCGVLIGICHEARSSRPPMSTALQKESACTVPGVVNPETK